MRSEYGLCNRMSCSNYVSGVYCKACQQEGLLKQNIIKAAIDLMHSGYDGPMIGEPISALYTSLIELEKFGIEITKQRKE